MAFRRGALLPSLVLGNVLLLAGVLAGCGGGTSPTASHGGHHHGHRHGHTAPPAGTTTPTPTTAPATAAPTTLTDRLLTAAEFPRLADAAWRQGRTAPPSPAPFGACQEYDLATLGSTRSIARTFSGPSGSAAAEEIAVFPDAMTALRAQRDFSAWQQTCQKRVHTVGRHFRVAAERAVQANGGHAFAYEASWRSPDHQGKEHVQHFGTALVGTRLALVSVDHDVDAADPAGGDAIDSAVVAAAAKLG